MSHGSDPKRAERSDRHSGVASVDASNPRPDQAVGDPDRLDGEGIPRRAVRAGPPETRDPHTHGHRPRVPVEAVDPDDLLESFRTGDPKIVYGEALKLAKAYREIEAEAARLRFRVNFGTSVCESCEGLRAGPYVLATCYQVKECRYSNVRGATKKQLRILNHLLDKG